MKHKRCLKTGRFSVVAGFYVDSKGYWCFSAGELRGKRVHRHLMEKHLGRKLRKDEHVHHRDGNKLNLGLHADGNWNLQVMGEKEHNAVSARQYWYLKTYVWPKEKEAWDAYHAEAVA